MEQKTVDQLLNNLALELNAEFGFYKRSCHGDGKVISSTFKCSNIPSVDEFNKIPTEFEELFDTEDNPIYIDGISNIAKIDGIESCIVSKAVRNNECYRFIGLFFKESRKFSKKDFNKVKETCSKLLHTVGHCPSKSKLGCSACMAMRKCSKCKAQTAHA